MLEWLYRCKINKVRRIPMIIDNRGISGSYKLRVYLLIQKYLLQLYTGIIE
jgi:hypothetical protein